MNIGMHGRAVTIDSMCDERLNSFSKQKEV